MHVYAESVAYLGFKRGRRIPPVPSRPTFFLEVAPKIQLYFPHPGTAPVEIEWRILP